VRTNSVCGVCRKDWGKTGPICGLCKLEGVYRAYEKKLYSFRRQGIGGALRVGNKAVMCRLSCASSITRHRQMNLNQPTPNRTGMTARAGGVAGSDILMLRPGGERLEVWEGHVKLDAMKARMAWGGLVAYIVVFPCSMLCLLACLLACLLGPVSD